MGDGLCQCGCGTAAPVAKRNLAASGILKGQPLRFAHGHGATKTPVRPGQRYGRLTVRVEAGRNIRGGVRWACVCDCGGEVVAERDDLVRGGVRSCGCLARETALANGQGAIQHGHTAGGRTSPTYRSWKAMQRRCSDAEHHAYPYYGGRGIAVCARWLGADGFARFLADMGDRPEGRTLDRIDNDGNYEPGNCRWATWNQQAANKRPRACA